jgi:hypothetical protein
MPPLVPQNVLHQGSGSLSTDVSCSLTSTFRGAVTVFAGFATASLLDAAVTCSGRAPSRASDHLVASRRRGDAQKKGYPLPRWRS